MTVEQDRAYWDKVAPKYDLSMKVLGRPMGPMITKTVQAVTGLNRVLEIGAGTGLVTFAMAPYVTELVATDYSDAMVRRLVEENKKTGRKNVTIEKADLYDLHYSAEEFDAVVVANVLHLVPDFVGAINSIKRVLKPQGVLIAPTYCHAETLISNVVSRVMAVGGFPGQRRFSGQSLVQSLCEQGLAVRRCAMLPGVIPIEYVEAVLARAL